MEKHIIDIDEKEHQQEECIEETDHIWLPLKTSEPDIVQSESPPPQTSSNQPPLPTAEEEPCIFRVHEGLRHVNGKAYTPVLVSIGPYHRGHRKLLPMEKHKKRYLKLLLQRNNQRKEDYLDSMRRLEERARKCYANPVDHLDNEKFVEMMLNDACFVIEFLRSMHKFLFAQEILDLQQEQGQQIRYVGDDDPIVKVTWMGTQICSDLMLLENQLPFFVLSEFYDMTSHGIRTQTPNSNDDFMRQFENPTLKETLKELFENPIADETFKELFENPPLEFLVTYPVNRMLPTNSDIFEFLNTDFGKIKHFLDLVPKVCHPHPTTNAEHTSTGSNRGSCLKMPCVIELEEAGVTFKCKEVSPTINAKHSSTGSNWGTCLKMPCVIKHEEAGVTFEEEHKKVNMFDIDFENGHFKIPKIQVVDWTETFFRNIIAYEQHFLNNKPNYFTDYTYFMDLLINSKEDVSQLRRRKIIDTMLGDDEEVAVIFNKLGNGTFTSRNFYYSKLCSKVNAHCDKWSTRVVAALKRDYFKNVWVTVATFAATFLLLLTLAQTVIALIPILSSSPSPH